MTPEQALMILDQASSVALLTREAHAQVLQAVQVLAPLVQPAAPAGQGDAGK